MNILVLAAATQAGSMPSSMVGDSFAAFLFAAGAVSLLIAGYLLYKEPRAQHVRYDRRR